MARAKSVVDVDEAGVGAVASAGGAGGEVHLHTRGCGTVGDGVGAGSAVEVVGAGVPDIKSSPSPPQIVSAPSPPLIESDPPNPAITSFPVVPLSEEFPRSVPDTVTSRFLHLSRS